MDKKVDSGKILGIKYFPIFENDNNDDKYKKIGLYLTNWESIAEKALYNNDISTLGTKSPCTY